MRLFIAIELSETMKDALIRAQNDLYDRGLRGNYTREENLHLTLAFIGDYPEAEPVLDALAELRFTPFPLRLEGVGCFGDLFWAGLEASAPLLSVVRRLRRCLAEREIPFDRKRFAPHVTLLRKASGKLPGIELSPAAMTVESLSLFRSDRGRNGMIYTQLGTQSAQSALE